MSDAPIPTEPTALDIAKKRATAQLAMEGDERRKKREFEEKVRKERELIELRKKQQATRVILNTEKIEEERLSRIKSLRSEHMAELTAEKKILDSVRRAPLATLSPLRTLQHDMNQAMKQTDTSLVSIAIKEDEKRRSIEIGVATEKKKTSLITIFSLVLLLLGCALGGYAWWKQYQKQRIETVPHAAKTVDSLVFAEKYNDIIINEENQLSLIQKLKQNVVNTSIPIGTMEYERFIDTTTGMIRVADSNEFFTKLNVSIPESLGRILEKVFMYGVFSSADNSGFIVLKTTYFEKAFLEMLTFEQSMATDLYPILSGKPTTRELQNARFTDVNIKNMNARLLKSSDGSTAIIYAFLPDKKTLVMSHNEAALIEVLNRITTPKPVRQ